MPVLPAVSTIAQTISLSLSPVFMLAGIGALLNVLAGRLSRVVDRGRVLEALHPASTGPEHDRHIWELRLLDRRISIINAALFLGVSSAVMTCTVVALLFIAELAKLHIGTVVALSFILAMALLIAALVAFMIEVRVSLERDSHPPGPARTSERPPARGQPPRWRQVARRNSGLRALFDRHSRRRARSPRRTCVAMKDNPTGNPPTRPIGTVRFG